MALAPDKVRAARSASVKASAFTKRLLKKRKSAPSWQTMIDKWGEAGAVRNSRGKVVRYDYPKPKDPAARRRIAQEVYEMWHPHRRASIEVGGENQSEGESEMVNVKLASGHTRRIHESAAEELDRRAGARSTIGYSPRYSNAPYWRRKAKRHGV